MWKDTCGTVSAREGNYEWETKSCEIEVIFLIEYEGSKFSLPVGLSSLKTYVPSFV